MRRALLLFLCLFQCLIAVGAAAHDGPRLHHFLMTQVEIRDSVLYFDIWVERPTAAVAGEFRTMFEHDPESAEEQERAFLQANFDRMAQAVTVTLDGTELELDWEPGPLVNNGRGNDEFFSWAIVATMGVPADRRELDLRIENRLFENEHIYLSCYVELDGAWRVEFDSARASIENSDAAVRAERSGVSWTGDPSVRSWNLRLRR